MTNADSSGLQALRVDGDFRRDLPDDVRGAATLLMAYLDGLTDGQRRVRTDSAPAVIPDSQRPPSTPAPATASVSREQLEGQATATAATESQNPVADLSSAGICGPISGDPMPESSLPDLGPSTSARDVVLVWGPGAYDAVRRALP